MKRILIFAVLAVACVGAATFWSKPTRPYVAEAVNALRHLTSTASAAEPTDPGSPKVHATEEPWNHLIPIDAEQEQAIGCQVVPVRAQTEPMKLELNGTTAYDEESVTQIHPRFNSLINKVYKSVGDSVAKGDKLVELFSTELAKAKSDFQTNYVQWQHDLKLLHTRTGLRLSGAISEVNLVDTQNNEAKSHLDFILAQEQLSVYGLKPEEIEALRTGLTDTSMKALSDLGIADKAIMTLRSPADGIVIKRDVVQGNLYEPTSVLMVIAPLDHLRVYANVYESDIDLIHTGQEMVIHFPFLERSIRTHIEVISNQVDPETHAMRVRTTIKNPGDTLKSDQLVRADLLIPPQKGYTVIRRNALITSNSKFYVFVKKSGASQSPKAGAQTGPDYFERREIRVRQEKNDEVIVAQGLQPGEQVASTGSLILEQMYEDLSTVESGTPL
jgi:cobalt-zinc-cadmium efflux system membrane fusion protein